MDPPPLIALIAASAVLVAIPGPNVALFAANTLAHGARHGVITVLGTTIGVRLQLAVVVLARPAIRRLGRLRHRLTGCLFIGAGVGLALARVEE